MSNMLTRVVKNKHISDYLYLYFCRHLRSVVPKVKAAPKTLKYPKLLKGGTVINLDEKSAELFGPVENYDELNRTLRKMFIEPDDVPNEMEMAAISDRGDYSDVIANADEYHDMNERELKAYKKMISKRRLEKKFFQRPKETNLLTHAAKDQIRFLHQMNPTEWTPKRLAECFPSSVTGIKHVLKSQRKIPEEQKKADDALVAKYWKCLKTNRNLEQIELHTLKLWREGKIIRDFYSGNVNLPQPPLKKPDAVYTKPKEVGEFASMVVKYVDKKKKMELANSNEEKPIEDKEKNMLQELTVKFPRPSEIEDRESASYLAVDKIDPTDTDLLSDQFQDNLLEEFSTKRYKTAIDNTYLQWMEDTKSSTPYDKTLIQPFDPKNFSSKIKKTNNNVIVLTNEQIKDKNECVSYLYDSSTGYQYPYGKEVTEDRIRIPKRLYKKGATYKVGQAYYNHKGYFLYKLPIDVDINSV